MTGYETTMQYLTTIPLLQTLDELSDIEVLWSTPHRHR